MEVQYHQLTEVPLCMCDGFNNVIPFSFQFSKPDVEDEKEDSKEGRLLTMAGIFDCWEPLNGGETLYSYSIITVDASKGVSSIHNRQGRKYCIEVCCTIVMWNYLQLMFHDLLSSFSNFSFYVPSNVAVFCPNTFLTKEG